MAHSWGPIEHPVGHNDDESGAVEQPNEHGSDSGRNENYDATDGRHNKADHQGWPSIDSNGGETSQTDFAEKTGRFPDGPGRWRQT
jgi:hypothetical protein